MKTNNGSNVIGLAGYCNSGKTTLVTKLIPELNKLGISVSTIKRAGHNFDVDKPGKDSYQHRESGANQVLLTGKDRWALMRELRNEDELELDEALEKFDPVDLIIVEGFKQQNHPKVEVHRADNDKPLLYGEVPNIIAIATDKDMEIDIPKIDLNNPTALAEFIKDYIGK